VTAVVERVEVFEKVVCGWMWGCIAKFLEVMIFNSKTSGRHEDEALSKCEKSQKTHPGKKKQRRREKKFILSVVTWRPPEFAHRQA
jgi:hypothetical protein